MALSFNLIQKYVVGDRREVIVDITLDASYPTGGEAITPADLSLNDIHWLMAAPNGGLMFEFDHANSKLKAFYPTGGAAIPAALAAPAVAVPAGATPVTSSGAQPNMTETAGIAAQVAAATDLSTIVTRVRAVGRGSA